jgi:EAL domain-containing protein (putative c-di-GMP-specific phosphodiesterase class I)/GGDEF domain-containing protein
MSLSKQLLALLSTIFLVIFSVNFIISINNIRDYLEIESEVHAQDTATSLGLALSPHLDNENDAIVETMMNAIFDRGYYKEIKLIDTELKEKLTLQNAPVFDAVPAWFIQLLPMKSATAKTEINSGWSIAGELFVTINPGYGYLKLYKQAQKSLIYSLLTFAIAFALLMLTLRFTLLPLKKIETLAKTIGQGNFTTIEQLPWTTEVRNVAVSMNSMSQKLARVFANIKRKLKNANKILQYDDLTGLNNNFQFKTELKKLLSDATEGYVLLIQIDGLGNLANQQGNEKTEQFLIDFAKLLKEFSTESSEIYSYRLYGARFAFIYKNTSLESIESFANNLKLRFTQLGNQYQMRDATHTGIAAFNQLSNEKNIMASAQEALEQARQIGSNSYSIEKENSQAKDLMTWKKLVEHIIDNKRYQVKYVNQAESIDTSEAKKVVMEEAFTYMKDENQQDIATSTFISIAEKYDKAIVFDQGVIARVIKFISTNHITHPITINLSITSVKSGNFRSWLTTALNNHRKIANQLVFSLTAYSLIKQLSVATEFIDFIHDMGAKVILKRYEPQLLSLDEIKQLKFDYLRLARDLTEDISSDPEKISLVTTIKEFSDLLDIKVLAENIGSEQDFESLRKIGIHGASRQTK